MRFSVSIMPANGWVSRCVVSVPAKDLHRCGMSLTSPKLKLDLAGAPLLQALAIQSAPRKMRKDLFLLIAVTDSKYNCFLAPSQMFAVVFHFDAVKINEWKNFFFRLCTRRD